MRTALLAFSTALFGLAACASSADRSAEGFATRRAGDPLRDVETLSWLTGSWADEGDDWRWEEHWSTPSGGTLVAMARMVQRDRTMFTEAIRVEARDDGIYYVVTPSNQPVAEYKLVEHANWQALFVSNTNRTPHTIGYRLQPDGGLLAWTENEQDGREWKEFFPKQPATLE